MPGQSSVRNGQAGRSAALYRLQPAGLLAQAYRTATGFSTSSLHTTTVSPSMLAPGRPDRPRGPSARLCKPFQGAPAAPRGASMVYVWEWIFLRRSYRASCFVWHRITYGIARRSASLSHRLSYDAPLVRKNRNSIPQAGEHDVCDLPSSAGEGWNEGTINTIVYSPATVAHYTSTPCHGELCGE